MKRISILLLSLLLVPVIVARTQNPRKIVNEAFIRGEKLEYRVYYDAVLTGKVTAGIATLEVVSSKSTFKDLPVYHVIGEGKSKGAFNLFFRVHDRFESMFDAISLLPYKFIRHTKEGDYVKDDYVLFDHKLRKAFSVSAQKSFPPDIQDIISAFYYARTLDFSNAKSGQVYSIPFFLDDSVYISGIQFKGRETVKTSMGEFKCLKFKPMVATGNVFDDPYPMTLWVTDDKNRVPVLGESAVVVGSVKIELIKYANLANPLNAKLR